MRARIAAGLVGLIAAPALAQSSSDEIRVEIRRFGSVLETAVRRVSRPSPLQAMGALPRTRGFSIPGVGLVLVLPAQLLPGDNNRVLVMRKTVMTGERRAVSGDVATQTARWHRPDRM